MVTRSHGAVKLQLAVFLELSTLWYMVQHYYSSSPPKWHRACYVKRVLVCKRAVMVTAVVLFAIFILATGSKVVPWARPLNTRDYGSGFYPQHPRLSTLSRDNDLKVFGKAE